MKSNLKISESAETAAGACSAYILEKLAEALKRSSKATIAISGGSTPKLLFADLSKASFDWSKVHFFWVDERCVPPTDTQSNFRLANETLLTPARIPQQNIHRVQGELPPEEAATRYAEEISGFFGAKEGEIPAFDIIHRGMGADAHTASLFPGEPLIADRKGIAAAVWVEKMKSHRVTLLPGVLLAASDTLILAAGADKAEPLLQILEGPDDPFQFPCQLGTRGASNAIWFLDEAAAARVK